MEIHSDSSNSLSSDWNLMFESSQAGYDDEDGEPLPDGVSSIETFLDSLFNPIAVSTSLEDWGLSPGAIARLLTVPELAAEVGQERAYPPFPAGYTPTTVELLYDDILFVRSINGQVTYLRHCPSNYNPPFFEMRFDDQMALFMVEGEVVVNRAIAMANLDQVLGRLRDVDWR